MSKLVFNFKSKDSKKLKLPKNILGGKGANLSEMSKIGLPVPPGFTISTKVCEYFYKNNRKIPIPISISKKFIPRIPFSQTDKNRSLKLLKTPMIKFYIVKTLLLQD